ncbi:hypothetical protein C2W62_38935 [Candidatus Entotheonella serta]|nr:hypothetical protein C2W62_38935 [Candidatus Entotheonella serta]
MGSPADYLACIQTESEDLKAYLRALPPDAWGWPSACGDWEIGDVVAHLTAAGRFFVQSITNGLQGDVTPLGGRFPAGSANAAQAAEMIANTARTSRQQAGDQLLDQFEASNDHLNAVFAGIAPEAWATPCYHPWGIIPARNFLNLRIQELALHGWDMRSPNEPEWQLSPASLPALMELVDTSATSGFLGWAFRPGEKLASPRRYRFDVTGIVTSQRDIVLDGETARLEIAEDIPATAVLRCDTVTYVMLMFGRLQPEAAMASQRLVVDGERDAVSQFVQWFRGI